MDTEYGIVGIEKAAVRQQAQLTIELSVPTQSNETFMDEKASLTGGDMQHRNVHTMSKE